MLLRRAAIAPPVILLADDDADARRALAAGLRQHGFIVQEAGTGVEALEIVEGKTPNIILLDFQMRDTDCIEFSRALKANSETARVPLIVLLPLGLCGKRQECIAAGAVGCATKPLALHDVRKLIQQHLPVIAGAKPVSY